MTKSRARARISFAAILLGSILFCFGALPLRAATWYAAPGATGPGTSASNPGDFKTLVEQRSAAGDKILLAAGTYAVAGRIYVNHRLIIRGAGIGKTILKSAQGDDLLAIQVEDATPANAAVRAITFLNSNYFQLDILKGSPTIENVEFSGTVNNASLISRDGHPVIKKALFKAKGSSGLYAEKPGAPALVTNCLFSVPEGTGISYLVVDSGRVEKCIFKGNRIGISLNATETTLNAKISAALIIGNSFLNNERGISLSAAYHGVERSTIRDNVFRSNATAVKAFADALSAGRSKIDSNRFHSNTLGLDLFRGQAVVANNLFTGHENVAAVLASGASTFAFNTIAGGRNTGIRLSTGGLPSGDRSLVVNNIFVSNAGYGIFVDYPSRKARLGGNSFYGNTEGEVSGLSVDLGGNLSVNPRFKAGSYALAAGSPCIDKAIAAYATDHDITGAKRTKPDIGAYEYKK